MATLSFKKPAYRYRIGIFLQKCKNGESHEMKDGRRITLDTAIMSNKVFDLSKDNKTDGKAFETSYITTPRVQLSGNLVRPGRDPKTGKPIDVPEVIGITTLQKTDEYKDKGKALFNKGNVAEGIFSAAIVARFIKKPRNVRIGEKDIKDIIMSLPKGSNTGSKAYKSPNKDIAIKDDVIYQWGLAQNNYDALVNPELWSNWDELVKGSIQYANSINVTSWSNTVYENNLYNKIVVMADGETAQTETKVDIKVEISDHKGKLLPVDIDVSLKAGPVGQFGQLAGVKYDTQVEIWKEWFDIHLPTWVSKKEYEDLFGTAIHDEDAAKAMMRVFEAVEPEVKKALLTNKGQLAFANAIRSHGTKNQPNVELVQLKGGEAISYSFDKIHEALEGVELSSDLRKSKAKDPEAEDLPVLMIYGVGTDKRQEPAEELLQIRVKRSSTSELGVPYYRTIFEKRSLMTKLVSGKVLPYFGSDSG